MRAQGWEHGQCRSDEDKKHPHLLNWEDLPDDQKWSDLLAAKAAIDYLRGRNLLKSAEDVTCPDPRFFTYRGQLYPDYIRRWRAGRFVFEFGKEFCHGNGLDIGGDPDRDCVFPGAKPINITIDDQYDAYSLPSGEYDYIFSSQTLEHLPDPVSAIEHWKDRLRPGGTLFLYLPHPDMGYWRPWNNLKHKHLFYPKDIHEMLESLGFDYVINSERDLYWGFCVVGVMPDSS
jgi:SAM-dependent methyltransferase